MIDKVLNKLGIYDIIGVLSTGLIVTALSLIVKKFIVVFSPQANNDIETNETSYNYFFLLVISYFIGILLQELGSLFIKVAFKDNFLLLKALTPKDSSSLYMSKVEIEKLTIKYKKDCKIKRDNQSDIVHMYNYCKYYCITHCSTTRVERDQSIAVMSRSLSIYFIILGIFMILFALFKCNTLYIWMCTFCSFSLSAFMFWRFIKFTLLRYVNIFRSYLYQN